MKKAIVVAFVLSLTMSANAGIIKGSYKSAKYVGKHAKPAIVKSAKFAKKVIY